jgi:hypothetical protein
MYTIREVYWKQHIRTGRLREPMDDERKTAGFLVRLGLLCLLAVIGFDLFLHAGVLSPLYRDMGNFLLPHETAFKLIPLGYLSFAILIVLLEWLMVRMRISGPKDGFMFGLKVGLLIWLSLGIGLASISTAPYPLLAGWVAGQAVELGLSGAIIGHGLASPGLKRTGFYALALFLVCAILAIVLQNLLVTVG